MLEGLLKKVAKYFPDQKKANHTEIYDELIASAKKHFTEKEVLLIKKAYLMAKELHQGQKRNSGEPYIIHPTYVAYILLEEISLHDANSIAAALLHDTIEDCGITSDVIAKHFNEDIAQLVIGVTKITDANFASKEEREAYNYRLLLLSVLKYYRVILIKLADRLHNMRTLEYKEEIKRIAKSSETLRLFVPLANHVGAYLVKNELAELCLKYLNDREYREIKGIRQDYSLKHQEEIEYELNLFRSMLEKESITGDIEVSLKSNFSIYQHLSTHHQKISEIPNVVRFAIMVNDLEDCKKVEKMIRSNFTVLEEYTEDFIREPKPNGYQALHLSIPSYKLDKNHKWTLKTSRITGKIIPIQIQIFTRQMFLINSFGFAALRDIYPDKTLREIQEELLKTNLFFKKLQENKKIENPFLFLEKAVRDLLADKIKVYVANGAMYYLPFASTVTDLANKIHSELKEEAIGALINGVEVSMDFPLKDEDHVIILTKNKKMPVPLALQRKKDEEFQ